MKKGILCYIAISLASTGFSQSQQKSIDSLMRADYPSDQPGAAISIHRHRQPVFEKAYGLADLRTKKPLSLQTNFNIGSLTKQFTAFAILKLHQQKKLSLTDSLGKYFTGLHADIAALSISQLLSHCSGIPDHYEFTDTTGIKHATDQDVLNALRKADTLYFPAGTHYRYSNSAYCLLGLIIEKISGSSYRDYLKQQIFSPLGMSASTVFQLNKKIPERAMGYDREKGGPFVEMDAGESIFFSTEADGGVYTSIDDYEKWCKAIEDGSLSGTSMIKTAWKPHTLIDTVNRLSYGYGWFVHQNSGSRSIYHTGSNGGFRALVFLLPAFEYRVCLFSNRPDIDLEDLLRKINQILQIPDNSFIKSVPLESFFNSWPIFAPCKETNLYSILLKRNLNVKDMVLN